MTKEEIIQAISDDKMMPFIQPEQLAQIVAFVINNYKPSLPSNLDEAAEISDLEAKNLADDYTEFLAAGLTKNEPRPIGPQWMKKLASDRFKAGAEWMAGQGKTKEAVIGMATEEIFINVSQKTLDELDLCPSDKVVVQIRKK